MGAFSPVWLTNRREGTRKRPSRAQGALPPPDGGAMSADQSRCSPGPKILAASSMLNTSPWLTLVGSPTGAAS